MILQKEYLTDDELEQLILDAQTDAVAAPPDLAKAVMHKIEKKERERRKRKNRDFAGYCFRVGISATAAIVFVFITPYLQGFENTETKEFKSDCPTKEEVLNDTGFWDRIFNQNHSLTETNFWNDLTEKDGGQ